MAELESSFAACLARLELGTSIEEGVAAYPEEAAALEPLLQLAAGLRALAGPAPEQDADAVARGRARLLDRAAALRQPPTVPVEDAFAESVDRLAAGASPEQCLDAFPHFAADLRPMLATVQALQGTVEPAPVRPAAQRSQGRQALLVAASGAAKRPRATTEAAPSWPDKLAGLFRPLARGWAMALVLLLALVLAGATVASARSALPGDALYGLKRATEGVQRILTVRPESRERLESAFEQLRRDEAGLVAGEGREVELRFRGVMIRMEQGLWEIEGVEAPLRVPAGLEVPVEVQLGSTVEVWAVADGLGGLLVRQVSLLEPGPVRLPPVLPSSTPTSTSTPSPTPSPTETSSPTARPSDTPTPRPTPTDTATPTATATPSPTATASPTPTRTATPTPSPVRTVTVSLFGLIEEKHPERWVISGQTIWLDSTTLIDESIGPAEIGAEVGVEGVQGADNRLLARAIRVLRDVYETRDWRDVINAMNGSEWVIGNTSVVVDGDTEIIGDPAVGKVASVRAKRYANQPWRAVRIRVDEPEYVDFEGTIDTIGAGFWVVGGTTVILDGQTRVEGADPAVGLWAEVRAELKDDGLHAIAIFVEEPSPTPTHTVLPTETPSPAPTSTPTDTPSPAPTVTDTPSPEPTATDTASPEPTPAVQEAQA